MRYRGGIEEIQITSRTKDGKCVRMTANTELRRSTRKMLPTIIKKYDKNISIGKDLNSILNFNWLEEEFFFISQEGIPYLALKI